MSLPLRVTRAIRSSRVSSRTQLAAGALGAPQMDLPGPRRRGGYWPGAFGVSRVSAYLSRASVPARSTRRTWTPATSGCGRRIHERARRASTRLKRASATDEYVTSAASEDGEEGQRRQHRSGADVGPGATSAGATSAEATSAGSHFTDSLCPRPRPGRRCEGISQARHQISVLQVHRVDVSLCRHKGVPWGMLAQSGLLL